MALQVQKRPDEAIIVIETHPPLNGDTDPVEATAVTLEFQAEVGGTICRITDYTRTPIPFGVLVKGMSTDKAFQHPEVISVVVGDDDMVKLVAEGFKQDQYGKIDVKMTASREEALALAHQLLTARQKG